MGRTLLRAVRLIIAILFLLVLALTILVCTGHLETGFVDKTLWDWLELVGIPVIIVVIAGWFGLTARRAGQRAEEQRERDTDRAREATLRTYLDDMTRLVLEHKLRDSKEGSAERAVAQAQTFMALETLDGRRKGVLLQFLKRSQLIYRDKPIISLDLADLTYANLSSADLSHTELYGVNLRYADLRYANLCNSDLGRAVLTDTDLRSSNLQGSVLRDANLHGSDLRETEVTKQQLDSAKDLSDALLPDRVEMAP